MQMEETNSLVWIMVDPNGVLGTLEFLSHISMKESHKSEEFVHSFTFTWGSFTEELSQTVPLFKTSLEFV